MAPRTPSEKSMEIIGFSTWHQLRIWQRIILHLLTVHPSENDRNLDYTIEILMSDLSPKASESFFTGNLSEDNPTLQGLELSQKLGITNIFPPSLTKLDAYAFNPAVIPPTLLSNGVSSR
jgi:hypothetical protein